MCGRLTVDIYIIVTLNFLSGCDKTLKLGQFWDSKPIRKTSYKS